MMKEHYEYTYRVKTSDLWQASMYYSYSSYMGIVNAVFIVSAAALIISRWSVSSDIARTAMIVLLLLFTVIQPAVIWYRARASLGEKERTITLVFSQTGLVVETDGMSQVKTWKNIKGIVKKPTILIIYMDDGNGYILRNSVLGKTRNELYDLVRRNTKKE